MVIKISRFVWKKITRLVKEKLLYFVKIVQHVSFQQRPKEGRIDSSGTKEISKIWNSLSRCVRSILKNFQFRVSVVSDTYRVFIKFVACIVHLGRPLFHLFVEIKSCRWIFRRRLSTRFRFPRNVLQLDIEAMWNLVARYTCNIWAPLDYEGYLSSLRVDILDTVFSFQRLCHVSFYYSRDAIQQYPLRYFSTSVLRFDIGQVRVEISLEIETNNPMRWYLIQQDEKPRTTVFVSSRCNEKRMQLWRIRHEIQSKKTVLLRRSWNSNAFSLSDSIRTGSMLIVSE